MQSFPSLFKGSELCYNMDNKSDNEVTMEQRTTKRMKRWDAWISVALAILIFFVGLYGTTDYPAWGDDYAAYYNEAIAIAEGTSAEQHARNYLYHPSPMPTEAEDGVLRYVWGYPLLLSFVYRIVGFDRVNYDMFVYYKLVSVIAFALCAALIYLFFRRRFSVLVSVLFAVFVGTDSFILEKLSSQYSDIVFMFFSTASLLLAEVFISEKNDKKRIFFGVLLGLSMWYTHEVRLNGTMIIATIAVMVILYLLSNKKTFGWKHLVLAVLPFLLCYTLVFLFEKHIFWSATGNASDFSSVTVGSFLDNVNYYYYTMRDWIATSLAFGLVSYPIPRVIKILAQIFLVICVVGVVDIIRRKDLVEISYVGLLGFFFVGASMLPYQQEGRYVIPLMPLALLCVGRGAEMIRALIDKLLQKKQPLSDMQKLMLRKTAYALLACYTAFSLFFACDAMKRQDFMWETNFDSPYLPASIEMYRYIQENIDEDALIITCKPRALYLNTQRESIPFENGHTIEEADYFLQNINSWLPDYVLNGTVSEERLAKMKEVYRTSNFVLYQVHE